MSSITNLSSSATDPITIEAGLERHRSGDLQNAAAIYRALLDRNPNDGEALQLLALVIDGLGAPAEALPLIERAVSLRATPQRVANMAMVLSRLGRYAEAEAACRNALRVRPDYPEALNTLGVTLTAQGRFEAAAQAHRRAVVLRPDYAEAHRNLGDALGLSWRWAEAEAAFRRAFSINPGLSPGSRRAAHARPRILYVAVDDEQPGRIYRCRRMTDAAQSAGWDATWVTVAALADDLLLGLDVLVFWRVELTAALCRQIALVRAGGTRVGLDLDDLLIDPGLARIEVVDGIRTLGLTEAAVQEHFTRVRQMLDVVDFGTCTTRELARRMREFPKPIWVLPNGFDESTHLRARSAVRARRRRPPDMVQRIGYAAGTRTHQRDFAPAAAALARVLAARRAAKLVLFREARNGKGLLSIEEVLEFHSLQDRIEWRDTVPLDELPAELARFDINIVPLESNNPFVEAKSELKYFEAALAGVTTVASPTGPFRRAIRHRVTGFLAASPGEWELYLCLLLDDPDLRRKMAEAAYHDALWRFGPQYRSLSLAAMLRELTGERTGGNPWRSPAEPTVDLPRVPPAKTLFEWDDGRRSSVTVTVASYNYDRFITEALDSVKEQSLTDLDLIIVDDGSTDQSVFTALTWAQAQTTRFHRIAVRQTVTNAGLGGNRNVGFAWAETPWILALDADNRLRSACAASLLRASSATSAAFVYPSLQRFGARTDVMPAEPWEPQRLISGNYIDAMALIAKWAWAAAGGFYVDRAAMGWEDYDLWCRFAELGFVGVPVPEILAEYRVHQSSMARAMVETAGHKPAVVAYLERRHPWLDIISREAMPFT